MKIGIGIPVHIDDYQTFYNICVPSLIQLNPRPYLYHPHFNLGKDDGFKNLQDVRRSMFDYMFGFYPDLDIAMSVSADYSLIPDILSYVDSNKVTTFPFLTRHPRDLALTFATLLGFGWSACFSIPRSLWKHIREHLVYDDSDVKNCLPRGLIKRVRLPKYYEYRYAVGTGKTAWGVHRSKSLLSRIRWMGMRLSSIK